MYGASLLRGWSHKLVLCTDGPSDFGDEERQRLAERSIPVREERIERVELTPGGPVRIVFMNGEPLVRRGIFLHAA